MYEKREASYGGEAIAVSLFTIIISRYDTSHIIKGNLIGLCAF